MKLRTDLQGHLHLTNDNYETVKEVRTTARRLKPLWKPSCGYWMRLKL
jgi:hypothetical protein